MTGAAIAALMLAMPARLKWRQRRRQKGEGCFVCFLVMRQSRVGEDCMDKRWDISSFPQYSSSTSRARATKYNVPSVTAVLLLDLYSTVCECERWFTGFSAESSSEWLYTKDTNTSIHFHFAPLDRAAAVRELIDAYVPIAVHLR